MTSTVQRGASGSGHVALAFLAACLATPPTPIQASSAPASSVQAGSVQAGPVPLDAPATDVGGVDTPAPPAPLPPRPWSRFAVVPSGNPGDPEHPNLWVLVPSGFDPDAPLSVVVVFHGFHNCLRSFVARKGEPCVRFSYPRTAYDLVGQMERAHARSIVVVPQLAYAAHDSKPGALGMHGAVRALVADALRVARPFVGDRDVSSIARVAYVSASGGFEALFPALARGGLVVHDVLMLDGFYSSSPELDDWLAGAFAARSQPSPPRFQLVYATGASTEAPTEAFAQRKDLVAAGVAWAATPRALSVADLASPLAIVHSVETHDEVARVDLWKTIAAAGL